jgi:hypothetical protein
MLKVTRRLMMVSGSAMGKMWVVMYFTVDPVLIFFFVLVNGQQQQMSDKILTFIVPMTSAPSPLAKTTSASTRWP